MSTSSSETRRRLLATMREKAGIVGISTAIPRCSRASEHLPVSFAQQRLWFLSRLNPENVAYNDHSHVRLSGALDIRALELSFGDIMRRHEILRTTFPTVDGEPVQVVHPLVDMALPLIDLRHIPVADQAATVQVMAQQEISQVFDLVNGPLLRAKLLQLADDEFVLFTTMHHIITDGWSIGVFIHELGQFYSAHAHGRPLTLPELPIQYADFAAWQRQQMQGPVLAEHLRYWQQRLAGAPSVLELPTDRPRPSIQTFGGARRLFILPRAVGDGLKTLSQREGCSLFMTLLAAFNVLLFRYTGQTDIVVGSPIAGRSRQELESLIGLLLNMLVLRTDLAGDPPFRALLRQVRETALGAYAHQDVPFEKLVEDLRPERDMSRPPLFQVVFSLQNMPEEALVFPGLSVSPLDYVHSSSAFDLSLQMWENAHGLGGGLTYNTDLFDAETIARLEGHFQTLLQAIVTNPDVPITRLPLLPPSERQALVQRWRGDWESHHAPATIHARIAEQATRAPHAVALTCDDCHLTYGVLDRRANQLAHYLVPLGVGPEVLVGICVERSIDLIIGLLGILKAGGAYLPLDPGYPPERRAFMLADSGAQVVLTQHDMVAQMPACDLHVVCLDTDWPQIACADAACPGAQSNVDQLAYVIYTSGSTGNPKGTLIAHRHVARLLDATQGWFHFDPHDTWTLFHSYAFDFSVWEIWGALCTGGRLVVVPYMTSRAPDEFYDLVCREQVTVLNQTPSAFRQLLWVATGDQRTRSHALRRVIFGGEALDPRTLAPWFDRFGDDHPHLVNMYGITETTVHVTYRPLTRADQTPDARSCIGVPIPDLQIYILDQHGEPVPVGLPGELYVGGPGLARGYLGRPDLTADRFVPNPFADSGSGDHPSIQCRLYRTGDRARYLANGDIEYLGRIDHQVKIRGFRIELGEIEALLIQHPLVRAAVVVALPDNRGDTRLVAYVVGQETAVLPIRDLREHLAERLPAYMVPRTIMQLPALPLTSNGKINRRALPAPDQARPDLRGIFVAPRTPEELQMAQIWEDVLQVNPVGVTDNFFDLGGHSLLAIKLLAQIEQHLGQNLPLAALFQGPTVEALAAMVQQGHQDQPWSALVPLQPHGTLRPFFCIHPVGGNVMCYASLARSLGDDQPCYGLQSPGLDDAGAPFGSLKAMAAHYAADIRTVQPEGPYCVGGWCFGGIVAVEVAAQLQAQGQQVALLALIDTFAPIPSRQAPDIDYATLVSWFARDMAIHYGQQLMIAPEELRGSSEEEQLSIVRERMQIAGILPAHIGTDRLRRYLHVYTSNAQALAGYTPPPFAGTITLLRAIEGAPPDNPTLGWDVYATQPLDIYDTPGNHNTMVFPPHVETLAGHLRARLAAASAPHTGEKEAIPSEDRV